MIVVDTNVLVAFVFKGDLHQTARAVFFRDRQWHAPTIWLSEFRNVVVTHLRTGLLEPARGVRGMYSARRIITSVRTHSMEDDAVIRIAIPSRCTAYDCEYVALAQQLRVPLITWDRQVLEAFPEIAQRPDRFLANAQT